MSFECKLNVKADLNHDFKKAFRTLSTNTHNVEPFVKAVDKIKPVTIKENEEVVFTENRWSVGGKYIPSVLNRFFGISELGALTHVTWNKDSFSNTWTLDLETVDCFDVSGVINFKKENCNDLIEMTIQIEADNVPMLPTFLEGTAENTVRATLTGVFQHALQTIADNMDSLIKHDERQITQKVAV